MSECKSDIWFFHGKAARLPEFRAETSVYPVSGTLINSTEVVGLLNYVTVIPKYLSTLKINYALYLGT